ncbi:MAG: flagellar biosynthesis anti-sigma factor FlgM [Melioribacteraceae bacterium]
MEIRGVSNNPLFVNQTKNNKPEEAQNQEAKDKIVISPEARDMAKVDLSPARLEEIRERINTKFYDSDEVLNKVADKILVEVAK